MAKFHETRMGINFFERDLPRLIKALEKLGSALAPSREPEGRDAMLRALERAAGLGSRIDVARAIVAATNAGMSDEDVDAVLNKYGYLRKPE